MKWLKWDSKSMILGVSALVFNNKIIGYQQMINSAQSTMHLKNTIILTGSALIIIGVSKIASFMSS
jgi:hypothetical protein